MFEVIKLPDIIPKQSHRPITTLCENCQGPFTPWPGEEGTKFKWYKTVTEVRESANKGCGLCLQFLRTGSYSLTKDPIKLDEGPYGQIYVGFRHDNDESVERWTVSSRLAWYEDPTHYKSSVDERQKLKKSWYASVYLFSNASQANDSSDDDRIPQTMELCRSWLETCDSSHDCRAVSKMHLEALPTRLIDIDGNGARLCTDTSQLPISTKYATLSHCWGLKKFLTLIKSNVSEFSQCIPFNNLTKTFREAIVIARSLGFKYIWIDSLCIIQDDAKDWEYESVRMGAVYGRSGLNIAATGASEGATGCWLPRDDDWRCQILLGKDGPSPTLYECITAETLKPKENDIPLMRRAWVLQERLLAPRTLHFTKNQVFWACRSATNCEIWPGGIPKTDKMWISCPLSLPKDSDWFSQSGWPSIVARYTHCKLTFGKDKLIAISSIAQLIQKNTEDSYVAGLWRNELIPQLGWDAENGQRHSPQTAPTWSWASNSGSVSYGHYQDTKNGKPYVEIQNVDIEYVTPTNPFGEILKGTLHLRCQYLSDCVVSARKELKGIVIDRDRKVGDRHHIEHMEFDDFEEHAGNDMFLAFWLPLLFDGGPLNSHTGIVIQPTGVKKGEYRRIGTAGLENCNWEGFPPNPYLPPNHHFPNDRFLPRDEYCSRVVETDEGKREYYISIV